MDVEAKVAENGTDSDNNIKANLGGDLNVFQGDRENSGNNADLRNEIDANSKTGNNDANRNTTGDDADPMVDTGNATSNTDVENSGNVNLFGVDAMDQMMNDVHFEFHFDLGDIFGFFHVG